MDPGAHRVKMTRRIKELLCRRALYIILLGSTQGKLRAVALETHGSGFHWVYNHLQVERTRIEWNQEYLWSIHHPRQ